MAVFGLVCAPTLSHAMSTWRGLNDGIEVCSAQGFRRVSVGAAEAPVSPGAHLLHHLSHCPLCGLSGAGMAPPPAEPAGVPLVRGREAAPAWLVATPPTLASRCDAQPRAPPALA